MTISIPLHAIELTPGSAITIHNLTWQDFEQILTELGEKRSTRVAYYKGILELMSPLPIHERPNRIIARIVTLILDSQGRDWDDFGSTTFKRPEIAGVEPDSCLYIQNVSRIEGCTRMDLAVYPPPDLAIESDVTSKTTLDAYLALRVPEVWIYRDRQLQIHILQDGVYVQSSSSLVFPEQHIPTLIPPLVEKAIASSTSRMLREFKIQLASN